MIALTLTIATAAGLCAGLLAGLWAGGRIRQDDINYLVDEIDRSIDWHLTKPRPARLYNQDDQ